MKNNLHQDPKPIIEGEGDEFNDFGFGDQNIQTH